MQQYIWRSKKPLIRHEAVYATDEMGKRRIVQIRRQYIHPGDPFTPSENERRAFGDLMEPAGEALRVAAAIEQQEHQTAPELVLATEPPKTAGSVTEAGPAETEQHRGGRGRGRDTPPHQAQRQGGSSSED